MCGITAIFHSDSATLPLSVDALEADLQVSLEAISHRGPDSRGTYTSLDGRIGMSSTWSFIMPTFILTPYFSEGLGHVRLSIIDLETGQQPLSDEDDSVHCVVAGEIYDHERIRSELEAKGCTFKTKSDSELVLQLWASSSLIRMEVPAENYTYQVQAGRFQSPVVPTRRICVRHL